MMLGRGSEGFTDLLIRLSRPIHELGLDLLPNIPIHSAESSAHTAPSILSSDSSVRLTDPWQAGFGEDADCSNELIHDGVDSPFSAEVFFSAPELQNESPTTADSHMPTSSESPPSERTWKPRLFTMNKPEIFGAISKLAWCPDCLASQLSYISCGIQNWNWIIAQGTISRQSCRMNHHCRLIRICRRQESPPSERTWKPRHSIRSEQSFLMATWTFLSPRHEGWLVVVLTMPSRASLPSCCWCLPPCRSCCGALRGIHIEWLLATEGLLCVKCRITFLLHRVSVTFVACKDTNGKKWIL